ncbi:MAG: hypothetical protein MUE36_06185 [Acidimicrobiales bacterium]|jgi:hypothetical protein|nr:hypothetical protein [Acidimicrobiales bacterium]
MDVRRRLAAFAVGLVVLFGAGWGLGRAIGPLDEPEPMPMDHGSMASGDTGGDTVGDTGGDEGMP